MPEQVMGNLFVRPMELHHAGDTIAGHVHSFDHVTFIQTGRARITATKKDGRQVTIERGPGATSYVLIKADVLHEITALEDHTTVLCVYAHRTPQGEVVQEYTGWPPAYS